MNESIKDLTDGLFNSFKGYVSRSIGPIIERLAALESRPPQKGEPGMDGRDGIDGKSADEDRIAKAVLGEVTKALESIPVPKDGKDGRDGVDGKDAVIDVPAIIAEVVKLVPVPKDGEPGRDGIDGAKGADAAIDYPSIIESVAKLIPAPKDGAPGRDGIEGAPGRDAEPINVDSVIEEVTKRIPVPKDGRDGAKGQDAEVDYGRVVAEVVKLVPPGKDGINGKDADAVDYARVVADVAKMFPAPKDGRDGRDGEPGKDAFAIEVLSGIDPERKYQRGTWAKHNGGLWCARTVTDGMTGWDNIVVGLASVDKREINPRETHVKWLLSDGAETLHVFKSAALLDRGVFKAGDTYEAGDVVTWDGSMWIAQKDTTEKPKESDAWRLSVKKGRDGRDGLRGDTGARGAEGRAGKDLTQIGPDGRKW
jgi:hypothetical protein